MPHVTSYGVSPLHAASSAVVMVSVPCAPLPLPRSTASSPSATPGTSVTSATAMSIDTAPTSGQRRPPITTAPFPVTRRGRPSA